MQQSTISLCESFASPEGLFTLHNTLILDNQEQYYLGTTLSTISTYSYPLTDHHNFDQFNTRKYSKSNLKTTSKLNSTFVSKLVANENIAQILLQNNGECIYIFFNVGKAFICADYDWRLQSPLSAIYFKESYITCHDVNQVNRDLMIAVIGFNSGDVYWVLTIDINIFPNKREIS